MKLDPALEALLGRVAAASPSELAALDAHARKLSDAPRSSVRALVLSAMRTHVQAIIDLPPGLLSWRDHCHVIKTLSTAFAATRDEPEPEQAPETFDATAVLDAIAAAIGTMPN